MGIDFGISLRWISEKNVIEIGVSIPPMPPFSLGMNKEQFLEFCEGMVNLASPFIDKLKDKIEKGDTGDISAQLTGEEFNKLLDLKKKLKGDKKDG